MPIRGVSNIRRFASLMVGVVCVTSVAAINIPFSTRADSRRDHTALEDSIGVLASRGEFDAALRLAEQLQSIVKSDPASRPYQIDDAGHRVARLTYLTGLPDDAREQMAYVERRRREIDQQFFGEDPEKGVQLLKSLLPIIREYMPAEFDDEAWCLEKLAYKSSHMLDSRSSESYFRAALEKYEISRGRESPEYAGCLLRVAVTMSDHGESRAAVDYAGESLDIMRRIYGEDDVQTITAEIALDRIYFALGDLRPDWLEHRLSLERRYLRAFQKRYGDSRETGMAFHDRAAEDMYLGRYDEAELYYQEALRLLENSLGTDHTIVASCLRNWGLLKCWQGDYEASEELFREAIRIRREVLEEFTGKLAYDLSRYAELKVRKGELETAENLLRESIRVLEPITGAEHPRVAGLTIALADVLLQQGRLDEAEVAVSGAREILKGIYNKPVMYVWGKSMAAVYIARGEYERADSLCNELLALTGVYYDETHPIISQILLWMGRNQIQRGELHVALPYLERAGRGYEVSRRRSSVQNLKRIPYAAFASPYPSLAAVRVRLGQEEAAWEAAERDRGRALLDMVSTRWGRELTGDELAEEKRLDNEIVRLSGIVEVLKDDGGQTVSVDADSVQGLLLAARADWTRFQQQLKESYPVSEGQCYSLERVRSVLEPGDGIVGWIEADGMSFVYLVTSEGPVTWVELETNSRTGITAELTRVLTDPDREKDTWQVRAKQVQDEWLAPIRDELSRLNHLYVIPSGSLAGVPLEALKISDREFVIDRWEISYIPSATVLVWLKERVRSSSPPSLFALGDPPFNREQAIAMEKQVPVVELAAADRGRDSDAIVRGASAGNRQAIDKLPRLGGTRSEIEAIGRLFRDKTILLGRDAGERELIQHVAEDSGHRYRYFHFATHALPHPTWGAKSSLLLSQVDLPDARAAALAGERILDGRLTMEEVMREWRLDADLVTLSACETALGQRARGEGYVGFAHAFFFAGARTVVVSLWKVADRPTRLLMECFYSNMLVEGMSKSAALRDAKMWLRDLENQRGETPYDHPYYWASFILVGDPGT